MNKIMVLILSVFTYGHAFSTLRIDIPDRPKEQVLEKAYALGKTHDFSPVTCYIFSLKGGSGTGIALDPYTILTAAHSESFSFKEDLFVSFVDHAKVENFNKEGLQKVSATPILHPSFRFNESDLTKPIKRNAAGELMLYDISLNDWAKKDLDEFHKDFLPDTYSFFGVDLAILKLDRPLTKPLTYPKILSAEKEIKNQYGVFWVMGLKNIMIKKMVLNLSVMILQIFLKRNY